MRALVSIALLGAISIVVACDSADVPNISGDYLCELEPVTATWCNDGKDRPHIVTNMNLTIEQSLPGSGMHLRGWHAVLEGYVGVTGDVYGHAGNVTCVSCDTPNEYDLELHAQAGVGKLESVALAERRHGDYPTPERGFFGYTPSPQTCHADWVGTCTKK